MGIAQLALRIAATVWLVAVSAVDLLYQRIPNWLVMPIMFGGLVWRIYHSAVQHSPGIFFTLVSWVIIFMLWRIHVFGGGDAKLLMGLLALFPDKRLLFLICVCVVLVAIPLILYRVVRGFRTGPAEPEEKKAEVTPEEDASEEGKRDPFFRASSLAALVSTWKTRIPWPTRERLETKGKPFAWVFALPGVVYVWWLF